VSDSAVRALSILEHLTAVPGGLTAAEISKELQMSRATVGRLLASMAESGWVTVEPRSNRYRGSLRVVAAGAAALRQHPIRRQLRPWLIELAERSNAPCALCFYRDGRTTVTDVTERLAGGMVAQFDAYTLPAWCTAAGKVFLAYLPEESVKRILTERSHPRHTPFTVTDPAALLDQIRLARERGYATSDREFTVDTSAIAVPVFDRPGHPVAALGVNSLGPLTPEFEAAAVPIALAVATLASSSVSSAEGGPLFA
jgi:DNA-binding IclR family transcriptional regulator